MFYRIAHSGWNVVFEAQMLLSHTVEFVCLSPREKDKFVLYLENENEKRNGGREKILKLAYPVEKKDAPEVFNEFFQSPSRLNRFSHVFEGIFVVNLTDYLNVNSSLMLPRLVEYIEENSDMDFVLFAIAEDNSDAESFIRTLSSLFKGSSRVPVKSAFKTIYTESSTAKKPIVRNFGY